MSSRNRKPQPSCLSNLDVARHIQDRELTNVEAWQAIGHVGWTYAVQLHKAAAQVTCE